MVGHRASLAGALYGACKREQAIKFSFSSTIEEVTSFGPQASFKVKPRSGEEPYVVSADVLLAADGVKSVARTQLLRALSADAKVEDTGQAAYRIMLSRAQMASDPALLALLDGDMVVRWIGERRHIIAYPVASKSIYNISTVQPDANFAAAPSATYTTKASKATMAAVFADFCPLVRRMLDLVPDGEVCEWKLRTHAELPAWTRGAVALVGDACHPTQPHLAQGAAQAIEDAAVLAVVLDLCPAAGEPGSGARGNAIRRALRVYEALRKERTTVLVGLAAASGKELHLGQGAAREDRDRQFAKLRGEGGGAVPDKWADADVQRMIYGHDCVRVAEEKFKELYESLS